MENISNPLSTQSHGSRIFFLDYLKVFLTFLVVAHHVAISYGALGDWTIRDPQTDSISSIFLTLFVAVNQSYFMGLFFLIAGYFAFISIQKKGCKKFIQDRAIKLLIPFLVYIIFISPLISWIILNFHAHVKISYFQLFLETFIHFNFQVGPLWFIGVLFLFSIIFALVLQIRSKMNNNRNQAITNEGKKKIIPTSSILWIYISFSGFATFLIRLIFPSGMWVFIFDFSHLIQYISGFMIGIHIKHNIWLEQIDRNYSKSWIKTSIIGIIIAPVLMILGGVLNGQGDLFMGGITWQSLIYSFWEQMMFISMSISLLHYFKSKINSKKGFMIFFSKNAYTIYILHACIEISLVILFIPIIIPSILKSIIVFIVTLIFCTIGSFLLRQVPGFTKILD